MQTVSEHQKQYLQYVVNAGGNATVATLDDDFEPIGPMIRRDLMPTFMVEQDDGKLALTDAGREALKAMSELTTEEVA